MSRLDTHILTIRNKLAFGLFLEAWRGRGLLWEWSSPLQ